MNLFDDTVEFCVRILDFLLNCFIILFVAALVVGLALIPVFVMAHIVAALAKG